MKQSFLVDPLFIATCHCCHIVFFPSERNLKIYLACVTGLQNVLLKQVICDIIRSSTWILKDLPYVSKDDHHS